MKIEQFNQATDGYFVAVEDGIQAGLMTYSWLDATSFSIDHTEASEAFKGRSVGKQLVMAAVYFAREKQLKILPLCPFARALFDKLPELADVRLR
jgi:uncharacterized protein